LGDPAALLSVSDVTISYPMDLSTQMLEYSGVKRP